MKPFYDEKGNRDYSGDGSLAYSYASGDYDDYMLGKYEIHIVIEEASSINGVVDLTVMIKNGRKVVKTFYEGYEYDKGCLKNEDLTGIVMECVEEIDSIRAEELYNRYLEEKERYKR